MHGTYLKQLQPNRQTDIHTRLCNTVLLIWGSLRLAPTSFVYILLVGGRCGMKPVPAAVQTALQNQLATAGIKVSVWSHLQEKGFPTAYYFVDVIVSM